MKNGDKVDTLRTPYRAYSNLSPVHYTPNLVTVLAVPLKHEERAFLVLLMIPYLHLWIHQGT